MSQSKIPDTNSIEVALVAVTYMILEGKDEYIDASAEKRARLFAQIYKTLSDEIFPEGSWGRKAPAS